MRVTAASHCSSVDRQPQPPSPTEGVRKFSCLQQQAQKRGTSTGHSVSPVTTLTKTTPSASSAKMSSAGSTLSNPSDPLADAASLQRFITELIYTSTSGRIRLPVEIGAQIVDDVLDDGAVWSPRRVKMVHSDNEPYYNPPSDPLFCPLQKLPEELRRQIFAESLPSRDTIFHPMCDDKPEERPKGNSVKDGKEKKPRGPVLTLMALNHQACEDVATMLYEERFFVIHAHEGISKGGIEFLEAGRQPLQLADSVYDQRFAKFTKNSEFGFDRLKKIYIQIHGTHGEECRHTAINTYFMNLTLCRLLQRARGKDRITSIIIEFVKPPGNFSQAGRRAIQRGEHYWWDPDSQKPRATSIHSLPDVQLVLSPFMNLSGCHRVTIKLPSKLNRHAPTVKFVNSLKTSMESMDPTMMVDDDLERNIEMARYAMEDYVYSVLNGKKREEMERMAVEEMAEAGVFDVADYDDPDEVPLARRKHVRSSPRKTTSERAAKRLLSKRVGPSDEDDEYDGGDETVAIDEMQSRRRDVKDLQITGQDLQEDEARQLEEFWLKEAIAASQKEQIRHEVEKGREERFHDEQTVRMPRPWKKAKSSMCDGKPSASCDEQDPGAGSSVAARSSRWDIAASSSSTAEMPFLSSTPSTSLMTEPSPHPNGAPNPNAANSED